MMKILELLRRRKGEPAAATEATSHGNSGRSAAGAVDADLLKQIVRDIAVTQTEEIGCDSCFGQIDHYVEFVLAGQSPEQAMPLVEHHLTVCNECREEFEALLLAVRKMG